MIIVARCEQAICIRCYAQIDQVLSLLLLDNASIFKIHQHDETSILDILGQTTIVSQLKVRTL